jgi:uncharacterized protein
MRVRVIYALADSQTEVAVELPQHATVADALARASMEERFSEIKLQTLVCAIFGRVVPLSQSLVEGDRIEILRPLQIDPKQSRRRAAEASRTKTRGSAG